MMSSSESLPFIAKTNEVEIFENCFHLNLPLLLKGPTGSGKSHFVDYMARKLDRPIVKVACNEDTNAADLLGRFLLKNGETVWQDGPVTRAVRTNAILYLDEFAEAREDVIVALHPLTDHRREVYLDKINETVQARDGFMVVASYNPGYQRGRRELKPSTKQRFVVLAINYLDPEKEADLIVRITGVDARLARGLATLAQKVRGREDLQLKETVSTRLLLNAALLSKKGIHPRRACHVAIAEVLSDDEMIVSGLRDFMDLHI